MADTKDIALAHLRLDTSNPRLADDKQSQPAALKAMMESQGAKLIELAKDIAKNGLNPLDGFLVMQVEDAPNDYTVLEGNRRTTALKLLASPKLGAETFARGQLSKLETFAKEAAITNNTEITCAVVRDRDEAIHWLRLRHGGELDGAGLVRWGTPERERFESRAGKTSPELHVLSLLVNKGLISQQESEEVKITNLRRLLSDGHVRQKLGVDIDRKTGVVKTLYPEKDVLKGLTAIAQKLANDDFTVRSIYTDGDRAGFIGGFKASELPNPKTKLVTAVALERGDVGNGLAGAKSSKLSGGKKASARRHVAPTKPALKVDQKRIKHIYSELQSLRLEDHTNSGAVMLRVFLELTVDHYIEVNSVPKPPKETLREKLKAVIKHLTTTGAMSKDQLRPIRKVADDTRDFLAATIEAFNAFVHSKDFEPSPRDVRVAWDNLEGFFVHIWK